jgi:hypothetical protein
MTEGQVANLIRIGTLVVAALALVVAVLAEVRARRAGKRALIAVNTAEQVEKTVRRPVIFPTDIFLNPYKPGREGALRALAREEGQLHPLIHRYRRKGGERDIDSWSLYSEKVGDRLRVRGQVNLLNGGLSEGHLAAVDQKFWWKQRPISSPPVAERIEFTSYPRQEFNIDFDVLIPDQAIEEGDGLYRLKLIYLDLDGKAYEERVYWWYDAVADKWWNNMNKVPGFDQIRALDV